MPETNPLQSEQEIRVQFNNYLDGVRSALLVKEVASFAMANLMMHCLSTLLIQSLSSKLETVKLSELFLTGTSSLPEFEARAIKDNLDGRLENLYAAVRPSNQVKMTMIDGKPFTNDADPLLKVGEGLNTQIKTLNTFNVGLKDRLGPDAPTNDSTSSPKP
jgi:hypothetical protein